MTPFGCSLLLAWGEWAVELSVYEEIRQDSTWTPWYSICPPLDPRSSFLIHEDVPTHDQLAPFTVMRSTETMGKSTGEACLEDDQRVLGRLNVPSPSGHTCWSFANLHSTLNKETNGSGGKLLLARESAQLFFKC